MITYCLRDIVSLSGNLVMVRQPEQPAENILVIQKFSVLFDILSGNTVKKKNKKNSTPDLIYH